MQGIISRLVDQDHKDWPGAYDDFPAQRCTNGCDDVDLDVSAFAFALANMDPDVWAPARPGELWVNVLAREDAARDILADLMAEYADEVAA